MQVLVPEVRRRKEDTGGGDKLAAKNTEKVQRRHWVRNEATGMVLLQEITLVDKIRK